MPENIYNPEFVRGLFNRMSGTYERVNYITSFGFSIRWRKQFLRHFQSTGDRIEVIDLMTGMGETWSGVRQRFPNAKLSALDFSAGMLEKAKRKSIRHYHDEVLLLQQDVLKNDLPANCYDIVICAFGLKTFNAEQWTILAAETKRILKPGGKFSFIEVSQPKNKLLKLLYCFHLGRLIPLFGKLLLGDPAEYRMLWQYTERFVNADAAAGIFAAHGMEIMRHSYFLGCATGFSGSKL